MQVTATYHGEPVTIIAVMCNGCMIYVTYIDASNNVKVGKDFFSNDASTVTIATGASV